MSWGGHSYQVWASRRDVGQERKLERQGTRDETSRDWRVRWDARIALSPTSLLKVEDGGRPSQSST